MVISSSQPNDMGIVDTETRRPAWTPTAVSGWRDGCGSGFKPTDGRVKTAEGWLSNTVFTLLSEKWHKHTHTYTHQSLQWSVSLESHARPRIQDWWTITIIPDYHQSPNTVTILPHNPFQWKRKGPHNNNRCASKSQSVNHEGLGCFFLEKKNWKQTKWQCSKSNTYAWEYTSSRVTNTEIVLSLCSVGALMRGKQQKWEKKKKKQFNWGIK